MTRTPADVPGLFRWWRSDDPTAGKADGDTIPTWVDRVAGQSLAPSSPAASAPVRTTTAGEGNGIPCVSTTATSGVSLAGSLDMPDDYTVGVVWKRTSGTTPRGIASVYSATVAARRFILNVPTTTSVSLTNYREGGAAAGSDTRDAISTGVPNVITAAADRFTTEVFHNGTSDGATAATTDLPPNTGAAATFRLFLSNSGSSNCLPARMWEFCIWDHPLTVAERAVWHSYVQDRYAITVADYTPPTEAWSLWNGTTEQPLTLDGVWNGSTVQPATVELTA